MPDPEPQPVLSPRPPRRAWSASPRDPWDGIYGSPRPAQLHPFPEIAGARHTAVSTPGDLLFHIRAERLDLCFELAQRLMDALAGQVQVVDEVHGFRSFDQRDLLGFVDGTENPEGAAALAAIAVGDEDGALVGRARGSCGSSSRGGRRAVPRRVAPHRRPPRGMRAIAPSAPW